MFQACVSISVCIFYVFMNIHRVHVCIYKWAYCWVKKKKKKKTYLPYFLVAPLLQYNNFFWPKQWAGLPIFFFFFFFFFFLYCLKIQFRYTMEYQEILYVFINYRVVHNLKFYHVAWLKSWYCAWMYMYVREARGPLRLGSKACLRALKALGL